MHEIERLAPEPWLPSLDVHAVEGELVLHADLSDLAAEEQVEVTIEGRDLILQSEDGRDHTLTHCSCLHLPFAPRGLRAMGRSHDVLEVRILLPEQ